MHDDPRHSELGHEPDVVSNRGVIVSVLAVMGVVVIVAGAMSIVDWGLLYRAARRTDPISDLTPVRALRAGVPVDANQPAERLQLRDLEQHTLDSYGWIDRERGIARIPIARAIELLSAKGLSVVEPPPPPIPATKPKSQGTTPPQSEEGHPERGAAP